MSKFKLIKSATEKIRTNKGFFSGFTLIELLVVITIIGILVAISTFGFQGLRSSARDTQRKADFAQIQSALELFKSDYGRYPKTQTAGGQFFWVKSSDTTGTIPWIVDSPGTDTPKEFVPKYIDILPRDPLNTGGGPGNGNGQVYAYIGYGNEYILTVQLESGEVKETYLFGSIWGPFGLYSVGEP